ncbi:MAG: hypothetical protein GYA50_05370 [Eubacteriaceae bacterium]|nr:hypothetical protein [Eubacteriaceae bacterium]
MADLLDKILKKLKEEREKEKKRQEEERKAYESYMPKAQNAQNSSNSSKGIAAAIKAAKAAQDKQTADEWDLYTKYIPRPQKAVLREKAREINNTVKRENSYKNIQNSDLFESWTKKARALGLSGQSAFDWASEQYNNDPMKQTLEKRMNTFELMHPDIESKYSGKPDLVKYAMYAGEKTKKKAEDKLSLISERKTANENIINNEIDKETQEQSALKLLNIAQNKANEGKNKQIRQGNDAIDKQIKQILKQTLPAGIDVDKIDDIKPYEMILPSDVLDKINKLEKDKKPEIARLDENPEIYYKTLSSEASDAFYPELQADLFKRLAKRRENVDFVNNFGKDVKNTDAYKQTLNEKNKSNPMYIDNIYTEWGGNIDTKAYAFDNVSQQRVNELNTVERIYGSKSKEYKLAYNQVLYEGEMNYNNKLAEQIHYTDSQLVRQGYGQGYSSCGKGLERSVNALRGGYTPVAMSAEDIAFNRDLSKASIETQLKVMGAMTVGQVGSMLTVGMLTGNPALASAFMGFGTFGNTYAEETAKGVPHERALQYAEMTALSEVALSSALGVFKFMPKNVLSLKALPSNLSEAIKMGAKKINVKNAMKMLKGMMGEGTEEYMQEILQPAFKNFAYDENNEIKLFTPQAAIAFIVGALTYGLFGGAGHALSKFTSKDSVKLPDISADFKTEEEINSFNEGLKSAETEESNMQKRDNVSFGGIIYGKLRKMFAEKDSAGVIETAYEVMNSEEYKNSEEELRRIVMKKRGEGESVDTSNNAKNDNADIHNANSNADAVDNSTDNDVIKNTGNASDKEQEFRVDESNILNEGDGEFNSGSENTISLENNAIDTNNALSEKDNADDNINTVPNINGNNTQLQSENISNESKLTKTVSDNNTNINSNKANNLTTDTYNNIINPIAKRFSNRNIADKYMRPLIQEVWQKLTLHEKESTYKYTQNSDPFNMPLRGYDKDWDNFVGIGKVDLNNMGAEQDIINLESAINKTPALKNDMWLFRGSSLKSLAGLLQTSINAIKPINVNLLNTKYAGKKVIDDAFMSTGISEDAGLNEEIAYEIYAPNGTKGIYVEPFSAKGHNEYNKIEPSQYGENWDGEYNTGEVHSEAEFLLQKGTKFEILEFKQISNKLLVILRIIN